MQGLRVGVHDRAGYRCREFVQARRAAHDAAWDAWWEGVAVQRGGQVRGELVGVEAAEDRDAEGRAEGAQEGDAGGGDAEVGVVDGVLHCDDQDLHGQADAEAEHEHEQRADDDARVLVHQGQEVEAARR